jgi:hypothetical protein
MELGIWFSFVKISEFRGGGMDEPILPPPPPPQYVTTADVVGMELSQFASTLRVTLVCVKWKFREKCQEKEVVGLKRKIISCNVKSADIKSCYLVFASIIICLCVTYLTTLSFAQTIQYKIHTQAVHTTQ